MQEPQLNIRFLQPASRYLNTLSRSERAGVDADTDAMALRDGSVKTKQLRGPVRELIVGSHRFTYFVSGSTIFFVRGFRKRTTKTPTQEIEYVEQVYRIING